MFCTSNPLYNKKNLIGRLYRYFYVYFETFSVPTMETLFLLVLSILALESADSIRSLYQHFLSGITEKSLNAFYYACSYAKADYSRFMNITVSMARKLVPDSLKTQPVFLCIDDTMAAKFGKKFEDVSTLFDHAAHNGSNYLNGHCFVSVMLCVPVWNRASCTAKSCLRTNAPTKKKVCLTNRGSSTASKTKNQSWRAFCRGLIRYSRATTAA